MKAIRPLRRPAIIEPLESRIAPAFSALVNLSALDGTDGFQLSGEMTNDAFGRSVSDAGDVNGDGFGDVIIGAPGAMANEGYSGASYVVFGAATGFAANLDLSTLDGANGFKLSGAAFGDESGISVSGAGDVNGDGFSDLIVGAHHVDSNGSLGAGASYVVFGAAGGFPANLVLSTLDGANGFQINGSAMGDYSGRSVSGAGDVNGDGFADLLVGAYRADPDSQTRNAGISYVIFGAAGGFAANVYVSMLDGTNGFKINGVARGDLFGSSVSNAGDVNGDGFGDVIVGAPLADRDLVSGLSPGASYVVFGMADGFAANLDLATLDGSNGFKLSGATPNERSGFAVSGAGDVNGDGFDDVLVGVGPGFSGAFSSYLIFGQGAAFPANIALSALDGVNGSNIFGMDGSAGASVGGAGDVNNDGIDDFLIGARGAAFLIFGNPAGFGPSFDTRDLDAPTGVKFVDARSAYSQDVTLVSGAGDVNGDGFDDLLFGFSSSSPGGSSFVVFGQPAGLQTLSVGNAVVAEGNSGSNVISFPVTLSSPSSQTVTVQFSTADGSAQAGSDYIAVLNQLITFAPGETAKTVQVSVLGDPDIEPDETFQVVLSNPANAGIGGAAGVGTILDDDGLAEINVAVLNGLNGFRINGVAEGDRAGFSVSDAGDVNGDGFGDLIVGASGASYVVFGKAGGFTAELDLATLDGTNGFTLESAATSDSVGFSGSAAGDVNGDGVDDLLVGSSQSAAYVVFGKASGFGATLELSSLDGNDGFKLQGPATSQVYGLGVSSAGDMNGDGFADIIVGSKTELYGGVHIELAYVVFGRNGGFGPTVDLSTLDGATGFAVTGEFGGFQAAVSGAGDINGDGFDEVIIGGERLNAAYVIFGQASGFAASLNIQSLDGANGFKINAVPGGARAGYAVSDAGDFNGDGFDDLLVSDSYADVNGRESGSVYLIFGTASGFGPIFELASLDGTNGFTVNGMAADDYLGQSVSGAGDVNGDGLDDVILGTHSGSQFVIFGTSGALGPVFELPSLDGFNGFKINSGYGGRNVSGAGDVNGDGFSDVIVGASFVDDVGASYVIFGKASEPLTVSVGNASIAEGDSGTSVMTFPVTLSSPSNQTVTVQFSTADGSAQAGSDYIAVLNQLITFAPGETAKTVQVSVLGDPDIEPDETFQAVLSNPANAGIGSSPGVGTILNDDSAAEISVTVLNGLNGFRIKGVAEGDEAGFSVSDAGDVNGDGIGDLIVGARRADPNGSDSGASYVAFGKAGGFTAELDLATLDGANGFKLNGAAASDGAGFSVSAAGDVNGDGFDDLLVGSLQSAAYVVFGKASGFGATLELSSLDGSDGFKLQGPATMEGYGHLSVSRAGDMNGDGFADIIVGAQTELSGGVHIELAYVVFGRNSGFGPTVDLSTLDGATGFAVTGELGGFQAAVSGAGDINGDGFDDVIIGGERLNAAYVVFGRASGFAASLDIQSLDGANGFKINAVAGGDRAGYSVGGAGDFNGDGFDDLIVGASYADVNGRESGSAYLIFGKASGFGSSFELTSLDGTNGFTVNGMAADDYLGQVVSGAGDVNGDGFDDVILGSRSGFQFVIFGTSGALGAVFELPALDGFNGFKINTGYGGRNVSGAGDVNGDGFSDVIVGAPFVDDAGVSYVIFGKASEPLTVSVGNSSIAEGDSGTSVMNFPVTLSRPTQVAVTVEYSTTDGTALGGADYTPQLNQTLIFAPGETSKTIGIAVLGDATVEPDETFGVVLSNPNNAQIGLGTGIGTILNDDSPGAVEISIGGFSAAEGDAGTTAFSFPVTLSAAATQTVTVQFSTSDGTALAGSDYSARIAQTLVFNPGETSKTITIEVIGDTATEADETFSVTLSNPGSATIAAGGGMATGTILNDDTLVRIGDASSLEGHSGTRAMTFTVSLTAASALPVSVNFTSADGTATAGADYSALAPGALTFAPGETIKTITVAVIGDTVAETGRETFSVVLSGAVNAVIDDATGTGTILDDDVTLLGERKATFTDADGERVIIKVSKGALKVEDFIIVPAGLGSQLALVDFSGQSEFSGADLIVKSKGGIGDGLADTGAIDATGIGLGLVSIQGDLGRIDAGSLTAGEFGVRVLKANSLGQRGLETQLPGGALQSEITGGLEKFKLFQDMRGAELSVSGAIGLVKIKGDMLGSAIRSGGLIGKIIVEGRSMDSSIATGVTDSTGDGFGRNGTRTGGGVSEVISQIAKITINGQAPGAIDADADDHFGSTAGKIGKTKIAGSKVPLTRGQDDFALDPANGDLRIVEV